MVVPIEAKCRRFALAWASHTEGFTRTFLDCRDMGDWRKHAACNGFPTRWWFPERGGRLDLPSFICRSCPVKDDCLSYAMDENITHGVWGGVSESGRRRLRKKAAGRDRHDVTDPDPHDDRRMVSDGIRT